MPGSNWTRAESSMVSVAGGTGKRVLRRLPMEMWAVKVRSGSGSGSTGRVTGANWGALWAAALVAVSGNQDWPSKRDKVASCQ